MNKYGANKIYMNSGYSDCDINFLATYTWVTFQPLYHCFTFMKAVKIVRLLVLILLTIEESVTQLKIFALRSAAD